MTAPLNLTFLPVTADDLEPILQLHRDAFGPGRFARTAYRIREGAPAISPVCMAARLSGELVAAVRFTEVIVGETGGVVFLGPLVVAPEHKNRGFGRRLLAESVERVGTLGYRAILLVGDLAYYQRIGFERLPPGRVYLPGPVDPARLLGHDTAPGTLAMLEGMVRARPWQD